MSKTNFFIVFLIINLFILNSALVFLYYRQNNSAVNIPSHQSQILQSKIDQLKKDLTSLQNNLSITTTPSTISAEISRSPSQPPIKALAQTLQTTYVPIPGSGSLLAYQWTNLPGTEFYFDTNDFPNLSQAFFEANMKLLNANGQAFLRLFDLTAGIEIWGSEIQTSSQSNTMVISSPITLRSGKHLLCVQAKSLTADTTVFNSGRLKIISR